MADIAPLTTSHWKPDPRAELFDLSIGGLLRQVTSEVPDRTAIVVGAPDVDKRRRLTYAELLREATRAAHALAGGFPPGSRVTLWSPNRLEFEVFQLGASLAGIVVVMVNPALRENEVSYILRQSRSSGLFFDDVQLEGRLAKIAANIVDDLPELKSVHRLSEWDDYVCAADENTTLPDVDPQSPAQIQYTSGTTGFPKGAVLRHQPLVTNAKICNVRSGSEIGDVFINPLPMFHVGSCTLSVIGSIVQRGTHVLIPRFDPALALELIETERGNVMVMVPTVMQMTLEHPDIATRDLSSLRTVFSGGANVPAAVVARVKNAFGCHFTNGFGQTEAHGTAIQTAIDDTPEDQSETIGRPLELTEVKIADVIDQDPVPVNEIGEVCLRGYQVMTEYFEMPEATAQTIDKDGWLHTGDLGSMDERGMVKIRSRLKDMIIRGGENVYPAEVENVLIAHSDILDAQVLGIPDEKWGEQVGVALRLKGAADTDLLGIYGYCRERLAGFKVPRVWTILDNFPTTASGKVQKYAIRDGIVDGSLPISWKVE